MLLASGLVLFLGVFFFCSFNFIVYLGSILTSKPCNTIRLFLNKIQLLLEVLCSQTGHLLQTLLTCRPLMKMR